MAWDPHVKERGKQKRDRCLLGCGSIRPNGPLHWAARQEKEKVGSSLQKRPEVEVRILKLVCKTDLKLCLSLK
jgi:selenophosphate synthetase-related protein